MIDKAIAEAENELKNDGVILDARESLSKLKNKHY